VKALIRMSADYDFNPRLLEAVEGRNDEQKGYLFGKITAHYGLALSGRTVGLWGLAFKPGTDDMREAPSTVLLRQLIDAGARVRAYDPVAMEVARKELPGEWFDDGRLTLVNHQYDALEGADALALVTEWKPFRHPDFDAMRRLMRPDPVIFDGRNQYPPETMAAGGFVYYGVGR